ncbi:MAG: hypothetical protein HQ564_09340 [Candidatus Saganbacteria bacterium]|nr:hypothetical protein [Candidatus Saganbacteria bacterium]
MFQHKLISFEIERAMDGISSHPALLLSLQELEQSDLGKLVAALRKMGLPVAMPLIMMRIKQGKLVLDDNILELFRETGYLKYLANALDIETLIPLAGDRTLFVFGDDNDKEAFLIICSRLVEYLEEYQDEINVLAAKCLEGLEKGMIDWAITRSPDSLAEAGLFQKILDLMSVDGIINLWKVRLRLSYDRLDENFDGPADLLTQKLLYLVQYLSESEEQDRAKECIKRLVKDDSAKNKAYKEHLKNFPIWSQIHVIIPGVGM